MIRKKPHPLVMARLKAGDTAFLVESNRIIREVKIVAMLWAAVISDVIAAVIGFIFVQTEIKKCEKLIES